MVTHLATNGIAGVKLSVLALSSRFDGLLIHLFHLHLLLFFQYSLCRVVLMVDAIQCPARC